MIPIDLASTLPDGTSCGAVGSPDTATVGLKPPLGQRTVMDANDYHVVPSGTPVTNPRSKQLLTRTHWAGHHDAVVRPVTGNDAWQALLTLRTVGGAPVTGRLG